MTKAALFASALGGCYVASASAPPPLFEARCGLAVTDPEAEKIEANGWLDDFNGVLSFWYNWNDDTKAKLHSGDKSVPFLPMWWGAQAWPKLHPAQESWCSKKGHTPIPTETGPQSVAFAWNEPLGGADCKYSMGKCPGGKYENATMAARAATNYTGCVQGAKAANRLVSTPCLNNLEPDWFRAFTRGRPASDRELQPKTVCCSHIYASQYNNGAWDSCDLNQMTSMDKLPGQLKGLVDDGTCDYHFIQEIGIGGCPTANASVAELLIKNLGNAVRDIPSVYLGWFANSEGDGGTARKTTWLFEENAATIGKAYKDMCSSLIAGPTPAHCNVGDTVKCPGADVDCQGNQCCPDGSTCPSADDSYDKCAKGKEQDCTHSQSSVQIVV